MATAAVQLVLLALFVAGQCRGWRIPVAEDSNLKSVTVVFRHGDRSIIGSYPTDPYSNIFFWPGGFGQLTNKGKDRHYKLGQWFRQRYRAFLPAAYSLYDTVVRSSDYDRTLMSAGAHLAGLYPPAGDQAFEPLLPWQPVPVHTRPRNEDSVLAQEKPCHKHVLLYQELLDTEEFRAYRQDARDLSQYLSVHTSMPVENFTQLGNIYDTLFIEEQAGYKLPYWTGAVYPQPLKRWAALTFAMASYTPAMARLMTGPFLYELVADYLNVTQHEDASYQKYKIYSAHDSTIANILTSLGTFNDLPPPYASALIFELRHGQAGYFVNLFYKNATTPQPITVKGCQFNCSLNTFFDLTKPLAIAPADWAKECWLNLDR